MTERRRNLGLLIALVLDALLVGFGILKSFLWRDLELNTFLQVAWYFLHTVSVLFLLYAAREVKKDNEGKDSTKDFWKDIFMISFVLGVGVMLIHTQVLHYTSLTMENLGLISLAGVIWGIPSFVGIMAGIKALRVLTSLSN